jgi:hypothetical protein
VGVQSNAWETSFAARLNREAGFKLRGSALSNEISTAGLYMRAPAPEADPFRLKA